ncbi:MAG: ABC transporter ATP-binding protein [Betaproteobacteria bacterium]|nr:ABC transporter ATP-binding protein [Betaproteobacteria bacterium]
MPAESPLLSVRGLSTHFRTDRGVVRAVDDVSFDLAAGETLALVGESGSGKSATALSLLRLVPKPAGRIVAGEILFEGQDLLALDERAMRGVRGNRIAMVFQEPMTSLNPALTVGLQVAEPAREHRAMTWTGALDVARGLLERVRIPEAGGRMRAYPHQFSGGMRQRAMIAMALACRPRLIVADEPTTALDVTVQAQVLDLLKQLTTETGAALLLITHDLGLVARYADRVAVMYAGRVVETARVDALLSDARHPYSRALLACAPSLALDRGRRLEPVEGQPPDLAALPPGCAFAPRCAHALSHCHASQPAPKAATPDHFFACVL